MALNHSGKQIKQVKILKNKVSVIFLDKSKLEISKETYTNFYFFEGKFLSNKEIANIKKVDETNKHLGYAIKAATSSLMTEAKLKSKLYKRNCSKPIVEDIIKILKKNDIINDEGYILDYLEYADEMLYGEKKIKDNLIKKGVNIDRVNKIKFSKTKELNKAKQVVKKLENSYKEYAFPTKKQKIYNALLSKGFVMDVVLQAITTIKNDPDDKLLDKEIKIAMERWMRTNNDKYDNDKEKFDSLYAYLHRKGYSYAKIKKTWSTNYEFND